MCRISVIYLSNYVQEAAKPKALKREEWMLVPPSSNILGGTQVHYYFKSDGNLINLTLAALGDPLKLKPRQFSRSTNAAARTAPNNLWTETPQERQQRIADEVSGKKRRAANPEPEVEDADSRKKQRRDEEIRSVIDGHNVSSFQTRASTGQYLFIQTLEISSQQNSS